MRLLASWGNQLAALADPFAWLITGHCCVFSMAASPSRIPFRHGPACLLGAAELKLNAPVGSNACRYATASLLSSAITSTRAAMSVAIASASRCASCPVLSAVCIEPRINVAIAVMTLQFFQPPSFQPGCCFRKGLATARVSFAADYGFLPAGNTESKPCRSGSTRPTRKEIHQQYKLFQLMQAAHVSRNATHITYTAG